MVMIDPQEYFDLVMKGFSHLEPMDNEQATIFTEDIFRWRWMARLRMTSFIALADELSLSELKRYMMMCLQFARKNRSKLGEPLACIGVVMSSSVSREAVEYALMRPARHSSFDEFPVVVDLNKGEVHYYSGLILYGLLYEKFEREYIDGHFALPMRILKEKQSKID